MQAEGKRKIKIYTGVLLGLLWIASMAVLGYTLPFFLDNINFFRAKKIVVYKSEYINDKKIEEVLAHFNWNWLFIKESTIEKLLNKSLGGIIRDVNIDRDITKEGIVLKIRVYEKEPVAVVKENDKIYLVDEEGNILPYRYIKDKYPVIFTNNIDNLKEKFVFFYENILSRSRIRETYVSDNKIILYLTDPNVKLLLPPLEALNSAVIERYYSVINIIRSSNLENVSVDLRFKKFASLKKLIGVEDL